MVIEMMTKAKDNIPVFCRIPLSDYLKMSATVLSWGAWFWWQLLNGLEKRLRRLLSYHEMHMLNAPLVVMFHYRLVDVFSINFTLFWIERGQCWGSGISLWKPW